MSETGRRLLDLTLEYARSVETEAQASLGGDNPYRPAEEIAADYETELLALLRR